MPESEDDLSPCPACASLHVERHYALVEGGSQPGCMDCETTMPLD